MTDILICGSCGAMGKTLLELLKTEDGMRAVCGVDPVQSTIEIPVYADFSYVVEQVDVVIDFSSPDGLDQRLSFAETRKCPIVIATTGLSDYDRALIEKTAKKIPVFYAANFSPAVAVMKQLLIFAARALPQFELTVIETHHKNKKDAPSGTAKTLVEPLKFTGKEIPVFSLRYGRVVGEHEAVLSGEDETLRIAHRAESKAVFARGAVIAAKFLCKQKSGLYGMDDLYKITPSV